MVTCNNRGFSFIELIITIAVTMISLSSILLWQRSSWNKTASANRLNVVTQVIEKQIENRRLVIALNPEVNYLKFSALSDTTIIDSLVKPPVKVTWIIKPETDPGGNTIAHVCRVRLIASWGTQIGDSLEVETCIGKNF